MRTLATGFSRVCAIHSGVRKPTLLQRFFASKWPLRLWLTTFTAAVVWGVFSSAEFSLLWFEDWKLIALGVLMLVLTIPLGVFLGIYFGAILLGLAFHVRGIANGGPFRVGDIVQIIAGKFRGRVVTVYDLWQGNTFRVRLSDAGAEKFEDIFSPTDVLLIERGREEKPHA